MPRNIFTYQEFINEGHSNPEGMDLLIKTLVELITSDVEASQETNGEYVVSQELEIAEPFLDVDFKFLLRKEPNIDLSQDSHFSKMKWQHKKLKDNGYALTGNVFMTDGNIPEVEVVVAIDSTKVSPESLKMLYYGLHNTISHELNHLNQKGWNRDYDNVEPSSREHRHENGKRHSYFLLPEEIESAVEGFYKQSNLERRPMDEIFDEYLTPFVESGFMSPAEMIEIIKKWIEHALSYYPGAKLSSKYDNIINNI